MSDRFRIGCRPHLRAFARREDGVAAVEFALVLPVLITLYFGVITVTDGVATKMRVENVARSIADLAGRTTKNVDGNELKLMVDASAALLAPYNPAGMVVTLASVQVPPTGDGKQGKVCWSESRRVRSDGSLETVTVPPTYNKGSMVAVPVGLRLPGNAHVVSQVTHTYRPVVGDAITGDLVLKDEVTWPTRAGAPVLWGTQTAC